ncbi:MAG: IMPACT family protein [Bacteroidota bacterium]
MLFEDSFLSLAGKGEGEFRDRGSRFIGIGLPVSSEPAVKELLQEIKKTHPQANHHCYAFRLGSDGLAQRSSDDREPSGSAGKPILGALLSKGITNSLIVVVRYFGGTLLGVPGLINAYRNAALIAIEQAGIQEQIVAETFVLQFSRETSGAVHQLLRQFDAKILAQDYESTCSIRFSIRRSRSTELRNKWQQHPTLGFQTQLTHD